MIECCQGGLLREVGAVEGIAQNHLRVNRHVRLLEARDVLLPFLDPLVVGLQLFFRIILIVLVDNSNECIDTFDGEHDLFLSLFGHDEVGGKLPRLRCQRL